VCERFGARFSESSSESKVGIALETLELAPLNGMRISPDPGTCGWYIWGGEYSAAPDFFQPLHVAHLQEQCPQVLPYLGLAPGWRFLLAPDHEDVWFDLKLLNTPS
jgi:hypothetical protein